MVDKNTINDNEAVGMENEATMNDKLGKPDELSEKSTHYSLLTD